MKLAETKEAVSKAMKSSVTEWTEVHGWFRKEGPFGVTQIMCWPHPMKQHMKNISKKPATKAATKKKAPKKAMKVAVKKPAMKAIKTATKKQ